MMMMKMMITHLVCSYAGALGAGEGDVDQALVVQKLTEYAQEVALMIVPP